jgi:hypothetical protein
MKGRWRRKCPCALAWAWLAAGRRARIFWAPPDTGFARDCKLPRAPKVVPAKVDSPIIILYKSETSNRRSYLVSVPAETKTKYASSGSQADTACLIPEIHIGSRGIYKCPSPFFFDSPSIYPLSSPPRSIYIS